MVIFTHPNSEVGSLRLRLSPTNVEWSISLNTSTTNTYGGQVIQLLSINYDKFVIEGRFGKEGPRGVSRPGVPRHISESRDYAGRSGLQIGLTQMTEYFTRYFAIASQGGDRKSTGNYDQQPMRLSYEGGLDSFERNWLVYPTSFPSYRRSNVDFAPEWRVEMEVVEADQNIVKRDATVEMEKLKALAGGFGYRPLNEFSDPLGVDANNNPLSDEEKAVLAIEKATRANADEVRTLYEHFGKEFLPALTEDDLAELIFFNASFPAILDDARGLESRRDKDPIVDRMVEKAKTKEAWQKSYNEYYLRPSSKRGIE